MYSDPFDSEDNHTREVAEIAAMTAITPEIHVRPITYSGQAAQLRPGKTAPALYLLVTRNAGNDVVVRTFFAASDTTSESIGRCFMPESESFSYIARVIVN